MGIEINDKPENQQHWNLEQKEALISDRQTDRYFIFLKSYKHDIRDYTYYFYRRHIHDDILQTEYQN